MQVKILDLINNNPKITISQLMIELSLSDSGVRKNISKLKDLGIIKREGSNKSGYWKIIK